MFMFGMLSASAWCSTSLGLAFSLVILLFFAAVIWLLWIFEGDVLMFVMLITRLRMFAHLYVTAVF